METISYSDCLKEMFALGRFGIKLELKTTEDILKHLGSPQKKFCSIHIAGTNGKGSIASYIASILSNSGFKTGLYTSPHLIKFNERFRINGTMVSDEDIVESFLAVKNADQGERRATFFEISTAMAFYLFAKAEVDWAVIETGMGGRLDATNVLQPAVTIISNLSIEHTEYLGNTLEEIAAEKGGIIKQNTPLVTGVTQESAIAVLNDIAQKKSAPVYRYGKDFNVIDAESEKMFSSEHKIGLGTQFTYKGIDAVWKNMGTRLSGEHQIQNSALALAACELLIKQKIGDEKHKLTEDSIRKGLAATVWSGRLEYIMQKPLVLIDGAHNLDAAENLGKYLKKHHSSNRTMIIGILKDKPYKEMLEYMLPDSNHIIFTRAKIDRSLDPKLLKDFAVNNMNVSAEIDIIENVEDAVEYAVKSASEKDCICIAGSLYVAGEARDKILKDFVKDSVFQG